MNDLLPTLTYTHSPHPLAWIGLALVAAVAFTPLVSISALVTVRIWRQIRAEWRAL